MCWVKHGAVNRFLRTLCQQSGIRDLEDGEMLSVQQEPRPGPWESGFATGRDTASPGRGAGAERTESEDTGADPAGHMPSPEGHSVRAARKEKDSSPRNTCPDGGTVHAAEERAINPNC